MALLYAPDIIGRERLLAEEFGRVFGPDDTVAVKLHYGQPPSPTSLRPVYAKTVVAALKSVGCKPFLFDSSVIYGPPRDNLDGHRKAAEQQGFTEESVGCPLVFTDDFTVIRTEHMEAEVCRPLVDADGVVVLTHVKGHPCSGMGGAIKNLGMGAVSKKTKAEIHDRANVVYRGGCVRCGLCEKLCFINGIELGEVPKIRGCVGCNVCYHNCPQKCFSVRDQPFDLLLSEGAGALTRSRGKMYYINVIRDVTKHCDCFADSGKVYLENAGVVMGTDIVAADHASVETVNKAAGRDLFTQINHKAPLGHVREAEKLGMGRMEYTLRRV